MVAEAQADLGPLVVVALHGNGAGCALFRPHRPVLLEGPRALDRRLPKMVSRLSDIEWLERKKGWVGDIGLGVVAFQRPTLFTRVLWKISYVPSSNVKFPIDVHGSFGARSPCASIT